MPKKLQSKEPLPPPTPPSADRVGPEFWSPRDDEDADIIVAEDIEILRTVMPRLWRPAPLADFQLALEVIHGPFKGVIFTFNEIKVMPNVRLSNGMVPAHFDATIRVAPEGFQPNEEWDTYSREVLLAFLFSITQQNLNPIVQAKPVGRVQG